jgi:hypothetical protein
MSKSRWSGAVLLVKKLLGCSPVRCSLALVI